MEHAVAGGVLDLAEVDLGPAEVLLEEREDLAQARRDVPGALHVVDAELLLRGLDADGDLVGIVGQDDDLGHVALNVIERREEHVLRLDAVRVDVFVPDHLERLVHGLEPREIVRALLRGAGDREGRLEPTPEAARAELKREVGRESEGAEDDQHLAQTLDKSHRGSSIDGPLPPSTIARDESGGYCRSGECWREVGGNRPRGA